MALGSRVSPKLRATKFIEFGSLLTSSPNQDTFSVLQNIAGKTIFPCFFGNRDLINYVLFCSCPVENCLQVEVYLHLDQKEKVLHLRVVIHKLTIN